MKFYRITISIILTIMIMIEHQFLGGGCRIFHRCHTAHNAGNRIQVLHYSFFCSDRLVFDQSTHTCRRRADAIPCETSPLFFDLNDRIGSDGPFLTHGDIDREKAVRPEYRRRRRR
ncbi:hypothetical protein DERF_012410 [Dermatophagoides farinae]|uniref:Chitin-binding type-2 domain-containing protein n=1 Tax=Dermatophagoides farinae TaxID=6954 RepID=A0A922HSH8_DERFA|nr:hypothetical protein DERF_012410 [Dermatophagoides farinae]